MNNRLLRELGITRDCLPKAMELVQAVAKHNRSIPKDERVVIADIVQKAIEGTCQTFPEAAALFAALEEERNFARPAPITYKVWGEMDEQTKAQMDTACGMPNAVAAATMPDNHLGYGLPIGGVLALENAVCPWAVGVDIACRMKLTVYEVEPKTFESRRDIFRKALEDGTVFGVGKEQETLQNHPVMDYDWNITQVTRDKKDTAWKQLGTSGSGNHFVEWGILDVPTYEPDLGLNAGQYLALLSHSGSRGAGANVCSTYSEIALGRLHPRYSDLNKLAWLDLDTEAGQEYWLAMNLMGDYASANHDVIHRRVAELAGVEVIASVENHHNFAWKEQWNGREVIVHRKGATPAGKGVLGVIPGSMADPAYVVRGLGNMDSINSASHGAGRAMSRKKAKEKFDWLSTKNNLAARGIDVISAGADEVPGVYKNIDKVMQEQQDLVESIARFDPKIVKMCGDDSRPED